ncbi:hypothetical protein ATANTOWER_014243 [Ataeniobius toweri]|uniref:Uncharacterized protein n=1 Tax=Ataeniobius toweri TaxID=208326 RepID=A0ABU7AXW4_9TELE|nr:hypothetical protein [Ataeniobius toweri]
MRLDKKHTCLKKVSQLTEHITRAPRLGSFRAQIWGRTYNFRSILKRTVVSIIWNWRKIWNHQNPPSIWSPDQTEYLGKKGLSQRSGRELTYLTNWFPCGDRRTIQKVNQGTSPIRRLW